MDLTITAAIARIKADDAHYLTPEAIKIVCQKVWSHLARTDSRFCHNCPPFSSAGSARQHGLVQCSTVGKSKLQR